MTESVAYPSGGVLAARVAEMAASLVASIADHSREEWPEAGGARAQAQALARRAAELGERDAGAYRVARLALARRGVDQGSALGADAQAERDRELADALKEAAEAPLELSMLAADIAALAGEAALRGPGEVRADAVVAALLAAAAARAAARLVQTNLAVGDRAPGVVANEHADAADAAATAAATL